MCPILAGCNSRGFYVISAGCHTIEVRMTLGIGQFLERKIRRNLIYALFSQCKSDDAGVHHHTYLLHMIPSVLLMIMWTFLSVWYPFILFYVSLLEGPGFAFAEFCLLLILILVNNMKCLKTYWLIRAFNLWWLNCLVENITYKLILTLIQKNKPVR